MSRTVPTEGLIAALAVGVGAHTLMSSPPAAPTGKPGAATTWTALSWGMWLRDGEKRGWWDDAAPSGDSLPMWTAQDLDVLEGYWLRVSQGAPVNPHLDPAGMIKARGGAARVAWGKRELATVGAPLYYGTPEALRGMTWSRAKSQIDAWIAEVSGWAGSSVYTVEPDQPACADTWQTVRRASIEVAAVKEIGPVVTPSGLSMAAAALGESVATITGYVVRSAGVVADTAGGVVTNFLGGLLGDYPWLILGCAGAAVGIYIVVRGR